MKKDLTSQDLMLSMVVPYDDIEKINQKEPLHNTSQLPSNVNDCKNYDEVVSIYEKHGIKVLTASENDDLFLDVILPENLRISATSHGMYYNILDKNDRIRAVYFYKSAFYDRDAYLNFKSRYDYNVISYLPESELGYFVKRKFKRKINLDDMFKGEMCHKESNGNVIIYRDDYTVLMYKEEDLYEEYEQDVYIRKYKNCYREKLNTPHFFQITDNGNVIFESEKKFFKKRYKKEIHSEWWKAYEKFEHDIRNSAIEYLDKNYENWKDTTKYF